MSEKLTPIVFVGGRAESEVEALVYGGQRAAALDSISRLLDIDLFDRPIVATGSEDFARELTDWPVTVVPDPGVFHFGRQLRNIVERFDVRRPFYVGGGSAPLLSSDELTTIATLALADDSALVANNFYSCDFVAFSPGSALAAIRPPSMDNDLAFLLHREAGLRNIPLERTVGTQFDVDTPIDLLILQLHPDIGPYCHRYLAAAALDSSRVESAMRFLTDPMAEIVVAGRVGSQVLSHLETDLACRKRVFSEERGMRASGREARGEVRSLLGYHLAAVGPKAFFDHLAALGQVLFLDSRVLFGHLGLEPSASDRFNSDLLAAEKIADPWLRDFTLAAREAPIPVLLGGHSLVSGGLWALIEAAWREHDRALSTTSG
jgi:hypothetical protein